MKPSQERAELVYQCFARGLRYQEAAHELTLDKNEIYHAVTLLLKQGRIIKIGPGQYSTEPGTAPYTAPPKVRKQKTVLQFPAPPPVIAPEPPPKREDDIEEIATNLLEKIGALHPLLALHKDLFIDIENRTMKLMELIIDLKPRILSGEQLEEYKELCSFKERAISIAQHRHYKR